jgi:hypothetical protein
MRNGRNKTTNKEINTMKLINKEITGNGNRKVFISNQNTAGIFESRLFIGDVASQYTHATHKTLVGAEKWAKKVLGL